MAPWLIFGAGGKGVGHQIAQLAIAEKHPVIVVVRNRQSAAALEAVGGQVFIGDACDSEVVKAACHAAGTNATVISTMGGTQDYLAHRTVIDCAEQAGISRMVLVTSLGCGDSWPYLSARSRAAFGQAVREKSLAESWLQTSSLDYVIVRPGGLLHGEPTGKAVLQQEVEVHGLVMRADVASHVYQLAKQGELKKQIYSVVQPGLTPS
ncbi:SDR family oxidoreductase [Providencia hangzhouensis]|uniref:SDR family oxidoreductase n=2 Tax=Providencia TaxID=586 RepID=A0AAJ4NKF9_PRORE|nr:MULTISPECIES: SDR family oxidoreductase [Providencia]MBJ9971679.1 SDR family oxidoreductase [Providencia rettgeri]MCF8963212.1 putative sugar epimerase YhfK [Providencia rettgeri]QWQ17969.1 SDR family oxidoreductase [Providencia rettgeri]QWQ21803.1 SDR family oxidoreductase [Providencia rettgeri]QWQ25642.1 SDR family oxidoreductase [Providencia rettgeri]